MALIRKKEIKSMNKQDIVNKIKELRLELVRASVTANKQNAKTKEIKRAISRLITFSKSNDLLKKK